MRRGQRLQGGVGRRKCPPRFHGGGDRRVDGRHGPPAAGGNPSVRLGNPRRSRPAERTPMNQYYLVSSLADPDAGASVRASPGRNFSGGRRYAECAPPGTWPCFAVGWRTACRRVRILFRMTGGPWKSRCATPVSGSAPRGGVSMPCPMCGRATTTRRSRSRSPPRSTPPTRWGARTRPRRHPLDCPGATGRLRPFHLPRPAMLRGAASSDLAAGGTGCTARPRHRSTAGWHEDV